ncbi:MAG: hypothetical protein EOO00_14465, partial [Chitinophagaceae bacterium]
MKAASLITLLVSLIHNTSFTQVLIKNVNVVDVVNRKILSGYNVVALDGRIVSVDKDRTYKLPEGTQVIEAAGK